MRKNLAILLVAVFFLASCNTINSSSSYDTIVDMALSEGDTKPNTSGNTFTYYLPFNGSVKSSDLYTSNLQIGLAQYTINTNMPEYLTTNNLITKNADGEYILIAEDSEYASENYNTKYDTRRIIIYNDPKLSEAENLAQATEIITELNNTPTEQLEETFANLAIENSDDINTSSVGGKLKTLTAGEMSQSYYEIVNSLEVGTYTSTPVQTEEGYQIVYLENITYEEEQFTIDEYISDKNIIYSYSDENIDLYIIENENLYNVIARNYYATVSTIVQENNSNDAVYHTITLLNSINVNSDIALSHVLSQDSNNNAEIINLNESNSNFQQVIEKTYEYNFSASFDDGLTEESGFSGDIYQFNDRQLTAEEIQALEDEETE